MNPTQVIADADSFITTLAEVETLVPQDLRPRIAERRVSIAKAADDARRPRPFRIAIVGRFKTGKSTFVNRLCGETLAGVRVARETAAVSVFRHAPSAYAEVQLLTSAEWDDMVELYKENNHHPGAHRIKGIHDFIREHPELTVSQLETEWLGVRDHSVKIDCKDWEEKEARSDFHKAIREFTATGDPRHYFVKQITVNAPIQLLAQGVELIDTPGLDDTEQYRVHLTEELLDAGVDSILFLTPSGQALGQSEKEFILRQLRTRRLRCMQIIATQVDISYEKACADEAEADGDGPTLEQHVARESAEIKQIMMSTLDDLLRENGLKDEDGLYYIEQLDEVKITHVSSRWDKDQGQAARSGIADIKDRLLTLAEKSRREAVVLMNLHNLAQEARSDVRRLLKTHLDALARRPDAAAFRQRLEKAQVRLQALTEDVANRSQVCFTEHNDVYMLRIENQRLLKAEVVRIASEVVRERRHAEEKTHWRSKRSGSWGYLQFFLPRIADKVFPAFEKLLQSRAEPFRKGSDLLRASLVEIDQKMRAVAHEAGLPADARSAVGIDDLDLEERYRRGLKVIEDAKPQLTQKVTGIGRQLEPLLQQKRQAVSEVWGSGTTIGQNQHVRAFFDDVETELVKAIDPFVSAQLDAMDSILANERVALTNAVMEKASTIINEHLAAINWTLTSKENERHLIEMGMNKALSALQ